MTPEQLRNLLVSFPWEKWDAEWKKQYEPVYRELLQAGGAAGAAEAGGAFAADDPVVAAASERYIGERIVELQTTTKDRVAVLIERTIAEGQAAEYGATPFELGSASRDAVREQFTGYERWRADRIARTECLLPETQVDAAVVRAAHRRWYEGQVVEVETASGRKFTTTPNHPMLTSSGWLPSSLLAEGHDLVCDSFQEHHGATGDQDVQRHPSTIAQVFDAVETVGVTERRRCADPDFHGDGREGYVDVACPNGTLTLGRFSTIDQPLMESFFAPSDQARARFCGRCKRLLPIEQTLCLCGVSRGDTGLAQPALDSGVRDAKPRAEVDDGLTVHVAPDDLVRGQSPQGPRMLAASEPGQGSIGQAALNAGSTNDIDHPVSLDAKLSGYSRRAEPGQIQLDRVLSVRIRQWSGHVFNLTTSDGYFVIAGGLYSGNTATAYNQGNLLAYRQNNITHVIVSDGQTEGSCDECEAVDGAVWTIEEAMAAPLEHPQCSRSFGPASDEDIAGAEE